MKKLFLYPIYLFVHLLLSLRYRIRVVGLKEITPKKGILLLANHPAEIDPIILSKVLWNQFRPRPIAVDTLFQSGFLRWFLNFMRALPIPGFDASSNSFKRKQIELTYEKIFDALKKGDNILIYPAGGLKHGPEEVVGGASGIHKILQSCPDVPVVLIRTTGLWGSSFSKAITGKTPELKKAFFHGAIVLLKNFLFFTPRRKVLIEISNPPQGFPLRDSRLELNRALEKWYNARGPEALNLVSYAFWKKEIPEIHSKTAGVVVTDENVPHEVRELVFTEIARLSNRGSGSLKPSDNLSIDLGLDSLDQAQLVIFIKETFGINGVRNSDLSTVGEVLAISAKLKKPEHEEEDDEKKPLDKWLSEKNRPPPLSPQGETILEVFLNTSLKMNSFLACVDSVSGEISYRKFRFAVILMAMRIQKMAGEHIGIMLPASVGANIAILATLLAGKIPVMVNWTLGDRNLRSILESSQIQSTLSSWRFLDRLENFELDGFDENIILLEHLRRSFTLKEKMLAALLLKKNAKALMSHFGVRKDKDATAVILYTSGTESTPKGVPLSNDNILSNLRDAFQFVSFRGDDVVLSVLPPFHSFGFSVTGIFPILAGMKVAYMPNPTDGKRIALAIQRWRATLLCIAPTFMRNMLRVATPKQLESLQIVVLGAEKASNEIYEKMFELNPRTIVAEGYGITECAPILTMNPILGKKKGVGQPFAQVELLVVDPATHEPLPLNTEGLILARGPNLFKGYLNPNLPSPFIEIQGKKWYVTGDLGSIDQENYLTLSGRLKRFVKIGGEMISLGAIEETLLEEGEKKNWPLDPNNPSLAVIAREDDGKKTELALFTMFPLTLEVANAALRSRGMSNLLRLSMVENLPFIPLLGTGKVDYRSLAEKWKKT